MQDNNQGSENLKQILEKINENGVGVTENSGGGMEFDFTGQPPKTALVFEQTDDAEQILAASPEPSAECGIEIAFDEAPESEGEFSADKAAGADTEGDVASVIWKTYVPRFTEATEKTYRFMNEDEYLERNRTSAVNVKSVKAENTASHSKISSATEEIDKEESDEAVVVNVGYKDSATHNSVNVFKFGEEKEHTPVKTPEELEKEEMDELFGRRNPPLPEAADEIDLERDGVKEEALPEWDEENRVFNIPDPVMPIEPLAVAESLSDKELPFGAAESVVSDFDSKKNHSYLGKRDRYKDKFLDALMATRLRLFVVIMLALAVAALENLPGAAEKLSTVLGGASVGMVGLIADICAVSALFLLTLPEIIGAITALKNKAAYPELSLSLVYLGYLVYSLVAIPYADEYRFLGSAYAVMAVFAVWSGYCVQSGNFSAFRLVSEKGEKLVLDTRLTRTLDRENMALDGAVSEYKSKIARDFKTSFVSKFFTNSAKRRENTKNNLTMLLFTVFVAAVLGVVAYFVKGSILDSFYAAALVVCFATPLFFVLSHKLPFRSLEGRLVANGSAAVGEQACYDLAEVDVIAFEDREVFGEEDVVFKSVSLSDRSGDFRKTMKKMSALFSAVGGPLNKLFEKTLGKSCDAAEGIIIEDDGLCGIVDGITVYAGSAEYMERHGITVPENATPSLESTRFMYGAEDGVVFAKFSIQYSFSEDFALMISSFIKNGITPLIYTRDPNVNNNLVSFLIGGKCKARVMKKNSVLPKEREVYKSLSATAVTVGGKNDAIDIVMSSKKYVAMQNNAKMFELVASSLGAVVAVALFVFGTFSINLSALLGAWHVLLGAAFYAFCGKALKQDKRKGRK